MEGKFSMVARDIYTDKKLLPGSTQIRVLDVHDWQSASEPAPDEAINVSLRVIDLHQSETTFTTLSYVWGKFSDPSKVVQCDGVAVRVTDNAHSALRNLSRRLGAFTIWIDAICIDQNNEAEKSHQIAMMGKIYSRAAAVYIWLGEGNSGSDRVMDYLQQGEYFDHFFERGQPTLGQLENPRFEAAFKSWNGLQWRRALERMVLKLYGSKLASSTLAESLAEDTLPGSSSLLPLSDFSDLLNRDWIRRIWTYQEIVLANNPVVVCGDRHISWPNLAFMIVYLNAINSLDNNAWDSRLRKALRSWEKIVFSRARFGLRQVSSMDQPPRRISNPTPDELQRYQAFIIKMHSLCNLLHHWLLRLLAACGMLVLVAIGAFAFWSMVASDIRDARKTVATERGVPSISDAEWADFCPQKCAPGTCVFCSVSWAIPITLLVIPLCYLPVYFLVSWVYANSLPKGRIKEITANSNEEERDDLVDALCTRKATDTRDMAFGVRSVLQVFLQRELPLPDTTLAQHRIYRDLTVDLLHASPKSLQFLLAASINRIPNSPSWIPDWSQDFPERWTMKLILDDYPFCATPDSVGWWRLDGVDKQNLTVRGRRICTISSAFDLRPTAPSYCESDRDAHLHNLNAMRHMGIGSVLNVPLKSWRNLYEQIGRLDLCRNIYGEGQLWNSSDKEKHRTYYAFLNSHKCSTPETILHELLQNKAKFSRLKDIGLFLDGLKSPTVQVPYAELLDIHIQVCNSLATTGRKVFTTDNLVRGCPGPSFPEHPQFCRTRRKWWKRGAPVWPWPPVKSRGVCNDQVEVGDQVILVAGLANTIVVRPTDQGTVRLISPAWISGAMLGQAWFCNLQNKNDENYDYFTIS